VILVYTGGYLLYIISRAKCLIPDIVTVLGMLSDATSHIMEDAKAFYFDLALSTTSTLDILLRHFSRDHILCGSDYPLGPLSATLELSKELDLYEMDPETRDMVYYQNAMKLFPRLEKAAGSSPRVVIRN
jgi:6-methylsalicylate decarboxylase